MPSKVFLGEHKREDRDPTDLRSRNKNGSLPFRTEKMCIRDRYKLILQFGKVVRVVETPGLSFKIPFLQTTQSIPNYEMIYDLIPSEVNTRDKKDVYKRQIIMGRRIKIAVVFYELEVEI